MNFQNDKYTLRFAEESDEAGIADIFESGGFSGKISVQFLRAPHPLASFRTDGDDAKIIVVVDNENRRMAAVAGAIIRMEYVKGRPKKCAYLTGLKIHPDYQGKLYFIAKAYEFLHQSIADCEVCYTTILDENRKAIRLLEKHHKNMPLYQYIGHYTTYCFHGGKALVEVETDKMDGFEELMHTHFSERNLTPVDYCCPGFGKTTFYSVREEGEITACCFVGNQQEHKQYRMCSYGGIYKMLSHLPTRLFGYPEFPKSGSDIDYGVVSYLYIKDNNKKRCSDFLRSVAAKTDVKLLIWGAFESNPLCDALNDMKTIRYGSRLYAVTWDRKVEIAGEIGMEAALL